ncbi:MAG: CHAP domain-containing protein [Synergistaceae bacterium]|nr:CHAP domain-containing protein [Synergistaceae bacterium]
MKRKNFLCFFAFLIAALFLSGGCGGGGGSNVSETDNGYYEPISLTSEQLIELAKEQVPPESFDLAALNVSSANFETADETSENELAGKIWLEAVKLYQPLNPENFKTQHGDNVEISQKKYVYVYRWTWPTYEVEDERLDNPVKQHKYRENGCQHGMYGTDCVGFVYNAARNAGVTLWNPTNARRYGPNSLATASNWKSFFPNAKDVSNEIGNSKPKPGDILSWTLKNGTHVGIAAKLKDSDEDTVVVLHCTGRTDTDFTCEEYKDFADSSLELDKNWEICGVTAHTYDKNGDGTGIMIYGKESKRLRLAGNAEDIEDIENIEDDTENENNNNDPTVPVSASALIGTWSGSGSGTGTHSSLPNAVPITVTIKYTIESINVAEKTAKVKIYERIVNAQYNFDTERDWNKSGTFRFYEAGTNAWNFTADYPDGRDSFTLTLSSENRGNIHILGNYRNEDDPSDSGTYDVSFSVSKQ